MPAYTNYYQSHNAIRQMSIVLESLNGRVCINRIREKNPSPFRPHAMVIGGFPRDEVLRRHGVNVMSKDIDVLITGSKDERMVVPTSWSYYVTPFRKRRLADESFRRTVRSKDFCGYAKINRASIDTLGHFTVPGVDLPVNLLRIDIDITHYTLFLDSLDFGINQIAYDGNGVFTSEAFERDLEQRTLTWCGKTQEGVSREKAEKRATMLSKRLKLRTIWPEMAEAAA